MKCIFCGRQGKLSREHLWPRWALGALSDEERGQLIPHSIEPHDQPNTKFAAPAFSATIKDVCERCNNGWMSKVEAEAKIYALPLILGEEGHMLTVDAQWALSRWTYLKILLFERVDKRQRLLPRRRYREMYESLEDPALPADMSVFVAAHEGERLGQYAHRLLALHGSKEPELFMGTITIRHLVVQVIEDVSDDDRVKTFQRDKSIAGHDSRIWPFCEPFEWPPGLALTDSGLEVFGGPKPQL